MFHPSLLRLAAWLHPRARMSFFPTLLPVRQLKILVWQKGI